MLFKKNFALLVLAMSLAGSVKSADMLMDGIKYGTVTGAAYAGAEGLINFFDKGNSLTPDTKYTITAALSTACFSGLAKYDEKRKKNEGLELKDMNYILKQSIKPVALLVALKGGIPALNWIFKNVIKIDRMVTNNQISIIDAQKIMLAYVTLVKIFNLDPKK